MKRPANSPHPPDLAKVPLRIPSILLEGDEPGSGPIMVSGQKYSLGTNPTMEPAVSESRELPEAYGTARLLFLARDPHSLYAHWDLTPAQQRHYNNLAADGHLVLRVHQEDAAGLNAFGLHVLPESRHWFVPVAAGGATYWAELGYYNMARGWTSVAVSGRASTPLETVSPDKSVHFAMMAVGPSRILSPEALESSPLLPPPRVSWLPGLGVEPSDCANQGPEFGSVLTFAPAETDLSAQMALLSLDWSLEQERALNEILGFGLVAEHALSSLQLVRASI